MTEPAEGQSEGKHERRPGALEPSLAAELRSWKLWTFPVTVVVLVMGLLGFMYMAPVVNPEKYLDDFPIVVVNADTGALQPGTTDDMQYLGKEVIDGLKAGVDAQYPGKFDLEIVDRQTALDRLDNAQAYGAILVPADFSAASFAFLGSAIGDTEVPQPVIEVLTNPGAGAFTVQIATLFFNQAMEQVNTQFGERLTAALVQQTDAAGLKVTGASLSAISKPIDIKASESNPLPDSAGRGLTAFYLGLLLILAGFTGSMIVHTIIDSRLGFAPLEIGPLYLLRERLPASRLGTMVIKWWAMFLVAIVVSGFYVLICEWVGMYTPNKMALWMFGVLVITGIGVVANTILAIFGNAGLIVNLVYFIILGIPSSGGTVPLEAVPGFVRGFAVIEPLHQAFMGLRSILYFDANVDAGLFDAVVMFVIFTLVGLIIGPIACLWYDRKGWIRRPPEPVDHPGVHEAV